MGQGYRPQLDGLRAIAIGLVGIEHFGGSWGREHFPIGAGALGVHLFFVLSGFLITRNLLSRLDRGRSGEVVGHFFLGRFMRLMPAYYLTLAVLFLLGVADVRDFIIWHAGYASNYLAASGGPLLVFWSLAVEEQFYLMLPVLLLISRRNGVKVALFLIATGFLLRSAVLATPIHPFAFELSIFGKFEILGIGVLIGALSYAASRDGRRLVAGWGFGTLALTCLLFQAVAWYHYGNGVLRHVTFNATVGTFFAWVVLRADAGLPGLLAWFSGFAFARFIGKISYSIYLTHAFFPRIFESSTVIERVGVVPVWAQGICVLVLSVAVPATSWYLMEAPLLKLKERLLDGSLALVRVKPRDNALEVPAAPAP